MTARLTPRRESTRCRRKESGQTNNLQITGGQFTATWIAQTVSIQIAVAIRHAYGLLLIKLSGSLTSLI
jgi:hypothetical protein